MAAQHRYAVECQSSYERGGLSRRGLSRIRSVPLGWDRVCRRAQAPRTKGGVKWTLIVRAEVGPFPPLSLFVQAHVDVTRGSLFQAGSPLACAGVCLSPA